jgi:hypothetical protein
MKEWNQFLNDCAEITSVFSPKAARDIRKAKRVINTLNRNLNQPKSKK